MTSKDKTGIQERAQLGSRHETNASKPEIMQNLRALLPLVVIAIAAVKCTPSVLAQTPGSPRPVGAHANDILPDDPSAPQSRTSPAVQPSIDEGQQTKRILGIIPNFRSVSVDAKLPPLSPGNKFKLMLQDSFDYSSFIYVGILAGAAKHRIRIRRFTTERLPIAATTGTASPTTWVET
jgi:hypothetical protein